MEKHKRPDPERVARILALLDGEYGPDVRCYLTHESTWQLLIAVILSAQCTDARVNQITPALFARFPDAETMAGADLTEVEDLIHSAGFYHNKAVNIIACSREIVASYGGQVPESMDELTRLPGVGRKTANVIRGTIYHEPSVVVDTHVKRISNKLGLTDQQDPEKIEYELMEVLPKDHWISYNSHIITLGRTICTARKPECEKCFLRDECPTGGKNVSF